ncbi:hypothetical protein BaRGS_00005403 [Batillaria attramentaria]|uniref:Uncharacterized protein n=1 Tax=Batillaria attramentaria TaxID=370345 RepID=A0ABD0LVT4_9CAEN
MGGWEDATAEEAVAVKGETCRLTARGACHAWLTSSCRLLQLLWRGRSFLLQTGHSCLSQIGHSCCRSATRTLHFAPASCSNANDQRDETCLRKKSQRKHLPNTKKPKTDCCLSTQLIQNATRTDMKACRALPRIKKADLYSYSSNPLEHYLNPSVAFKLSKIAPRRDALAWERAENVNKKLSLPKRLCAPRAVHLYLSSSRL